MKPLLLALVLLLPGVQSPVSRPPIPPTSPGPRIVRCLASWYGGARHHGRLTASGEIFDEWAQTCAHRFLPFGTWVTIRRADSGRWAVARVTDRGPAEWTGREIDVSHGVAMQLGMIEAGVIPVLVEVSP